MKELSLEQKAKLYDEAIERAKIYYSTTDSAADAEVIELIFPELKGADDERIRKELIKIVNDHYSLFKEIDRAKTIAWLEKQGRIVEEYEDKLDRVSCESFDKGYKAALEKSGEQNAWSEEDAKMLNIAITLLNEFGGDRDAGAYTLQEMACRNCADWLKSLKNCAQYKAEWSEDDEKMFARCAACLGYHYHDGMMTREEYEEARDWLKSLKPQSQWKPSDEQMRVLEELVEDNNQRYFYTVLKSLYEQLKKLREE